MALVKYNNQSISDVTATAGMPAGAMTLIKEQAASSSSTISFVDGASDVDLDSTYPIYLFKVINIHPSDDRSGLQFQFTIDGGSNYNTTITSTNMRAYHEEDDSATQLAYNSGEDLAQSTNFMHLTGNDIGNANDECLSGELFVFNPASTTFVKHFIGTTQCLGGNEVSAESFIAGYSNTTSAINGVQFKQSAGTIDAGTFKLYGIKDS